MGVVPDYTWQLPSLSPLCPLTRSLHHGSSPKRCNCRAVCRKPVGLSPSEAPCSASALEPPLARTVNTRDRLRVPLPPTLHRGGALPLNCPARFSRPGGDGSAAVRSVMVHSCRETAGGCPPILYYGYVQWASGARAFTNQWWCCIVVFGPMGICGFTWHWRIFGRVVFPFLWHSMCFHIRGFLCRPP